MIINKLLIKVILFCIIALFAMLSPVYAQDPGADDGEEVPIIVAPSGRLDLTLEQLGYDTQQLDRENSEVIYRIDLPGNFQILPTGNYIDLNISHVIEIPGQSAPLLVGMNRQPLTALTLTAENVSTNTVRLDLPEDLLQLGRNSIEINLDAGGSCEEPVGTPIEVSVGEDSTLSFGYQQNPYPIDLGLYPFPFTERSLINIPVTIVLPDQPTSNDLSVAATIAAGLGRLARGSIDLTAVPAGDLDADLRDNNHLIVLGQPSNNSLLNDLELPLPIDSTILEPGQGILEEITSPWNEFRLILVVGGLNEDGLLKASQTLNRQAHFLGMRGPVAVVLDLLPLSEEISPVTSMTLASLGYRDEIAYGATPKNFTFEFFLPTDWRLEDPPFFVLKFAHADILDPFQSIIDIKLNDLPIGSALLDESNANTGELTVSLPERRLKSGRNRLEVGIEMNLPNGDKCRDKDDQRAWAVVSSESEIFLPYSAIDSLPDLGLLPYPFSQELGFDQTTIVLPDQAPPSIIDDVINLALWLGGASRTEFISAHVAYASEINEDILAKHHLIMLGRPTEHALLSEVNTYLPQPFESDGTTLRPLVIDSVSFLPDPNRDAGLLEIITSPWSEEYSVLAITGTTGQGVDLALQTLLEGGNRLRGNLAVIEPALAPSTEEPNQVSTYSIDTRTSLSAVQEEPSTASTISESDLILLSNRWWK